MSVNINEDIVDISGMTLEMFGNRNQSVDMEWLWKKERTVNCWGLNQADEQISLLQVPAASWCNDFWALKTFIPETYDDDESLSKIYLTTKLNPI